MWLKDYFRRKKLERDARRLVGAAFRFPEKFRGTSLKPRHAGRWVLVDFEAQDGKVARVWFGILRHPRPYSFSRQSHKVIEYYCYHVEAGRMERLEGYNLTREKGEDADR